MMLYYVIIFVVAAAIGAMAAMLVGNKRLTRLTADNATMRSLLQQKDRQIEQAQSQMAEQRQQYAADTARAQQELERIARESDRRQQDNERMMAERFQKMKEEFQTTSESVLRTRQQQLEKTGKDTLQGIADPLMAELKRMQSIVGDTDREHQKAIAELKASIRANMEQSKGLGEKADSLAEALRGENKTQGNFGELRLKQLLDNMEFVEGEQYEQQTTLTDESGKTIKSSDGHSLQPDVILKFPDNRHLIIDSKVSLTAFLDYNNAKTDEEKKGALERHLKSIKAHVDELAKKDYASYLPGGGVDFVIMFVFNEGAIQLALTAEPKLYEEAWKKKVIICSGSNLYGLLRLLASAWKQQRRLENEQKLMAAAKDVVERVQMFRERFEKVESALRSTQAAVDDVKNITKDGGHSIITATRKMLKFGAEQSTKHAALPEPDNTNEYEEEKPAPKSTNA